ncbi:Phosphatidylinositol 3- and 4-kinase [Musa troglodytarum]|uniref:Phosphatidylinositol 3- and 4-kinase n=1 Tax=Musa troglodytarum TaxID=320322 RepID=A0A9E7KYJ4_9LILI|nr:Phosphatidylinositol 3- and 4-kinase [Musa troglodytarum]URE34118.1 Phosphatidylinositol 3- and 4-kinase [Musa troglodytarum]URE34121.1 Phosphatidylinositol 3- and 4-kinase [Musa troglodytarum]URE34126.1 Phosphatidylinositol 3- and 4-kinase [Musa troglodytarum]
MIERRVFFSCVSLRLMLPALHKSRAGEGRVGGEGPDPPPWDRPPDLIPVVGRRGAGACLLSGEISPPVLTFHISRMPN